MKRGIWENKGRSRNRIVVDVNSSPLGFHLDGIKSFVSIGCVG